MKVKDPVCGMTIEDSKAAARTGSGAETVYFCSTACKATYDRSHAPAPG
jgi:YHS domain-containing protein